LFSNETGEEAKIFLTQIRKLKPRYARDQYGLIRKTIENSSQQAVYKALNYCITHSLYSATEFRNAAGYFENRIETEMGQFMKAGNVIAFESPAAVSKKRPLTEYAQAAKGGGK
jgi:hypothetical protein